MSELKNKSDLSISSAEHLHKASLYNSVAHCAYYSCVQLMKYIIIKKDGYDDVKIKNESGTSVHSFLITYFKKRLEESNKNYKDFYSGITQLKGVRVKVDYFEDKLDYSKSSQVISTANNINNILRTLL